MFSFRRSRLKVTTGAAPAGRCPYCKDELTAAEGATRCPSCGVSSHAACWEQNGGCAVFGCRSDVRFTVARSLPAPGWTVSFADVVAGTSAWCATILGLAFLIFLPLTMTSMIALSADSFHEWVLTRSYLAASLAVASILVAGLMRKGLRDRAGQTAFVLAFALTILGVLCAGGIWTRAHLPY